MKNIQSFIANISAPKTFEQLQYHMKDYGGYVIERVIEDPDGPGNWTAPRWAKIGDIVFFMHTVSAGQYLKSIRRKITLQKESYSKEDFDEAMKFLQRGLDLHSRYGGKIFAVSRVIGEPEYYDDEESYYWHSHIYADIGDMILLDSPVDYSEFKSFLPVARQTSITPVIGQNFDILRDLIISHGNILPDYVLDAEAAPLPLSAVNSENWLELCYDYRRRFFLEEQFRKFYADYLLRALSDDGRFYSECRVRKNGAADSFVDNVILFDGKYIPVEVKLNVSNEANLTAQLERYCDFDALFKNRRAKNSFPHEKLHSRKIIVIDTENLFIFSCPDKNLTPALQLDSLKRITDLFSAKQELSRLLKMNLSI